jgi:hypothetical protein
MAPFVMSAAAGCGARSSARNAQAASPMAGIAITKATAAAVMR